MKIKNCFTIILSLVAAKSFAVTQVELLNAQYNYQVVSKQYERNKSKYLEAKNLQEEAEKNLKIAQKNFQQSQEQLKTTKQEFEQSQQKLNTASTSVNDIWNQLNHNNQTNSLKQ